MTSEFSRAPYRSALMASVMAVLLIGCSPKSEEQKSGTPGNVTLTDAQRQHIKLYRVAAAQYHGVVDTTGVVDFDNDHATAIISPISGPVTRLFVSPGDTVRQGAPLAAVASPDFTAAVSAYRKALVTAQNLRRIADADKDLVQHQGVSQREAQQAETDASGAEADRDAALQAVVALNVDPQTIKDIEAGKPVARIEGFIRAPVAGTVVDRSITQGQLLQAGTTAAFTVADLSRVWVMAQIFESDIAAVAVGDSAKVTTGPETLPGAVTSITPQIDPNTRSMQARVVVDNARRILKKQMYVHVQIQGRQDRIGILIPVSSILRDDENLPFVYRLQHDGSFARQHVTLGNRIGDNDAIPSGLNAGDQIVVDGALFLQFMQNQ